MSASPPAATDLTDSRLPNPTVDPSTATGGAESDPTLLGLTDTTPTAVVVKLNFAPVSTYAGGLSGLAATSPATTHQAGINPSDPAVKAYTTYTDSVITTFTTALHAQIPAAKVGSTLQLVYGGVAVQVPANRVRTLLSMPGVVAVQRDQQIRTASTGGVEAALTGATKVWPSLGGADRAGAGITIGMIDTGIWPEHPSFRDPGNLPPVPALPGGRARTCDFGDNPLTKAYDPFVCNRKVISGQAFLDTYYAFYDIYLDNARDADGHGTLTASYAAGDRVQHATYLGNDLGNISGMAPGARLAIYKSGDFEVSFASDVIAAIGQAVADHVDVISASIGADSSDPWQDPLQLAYLDAYRNGISVVAAAGNDGPAASSVYNIAPWVTTVGATTGPRGFGSSLHLTAPSGAALTLSGTTFTPGLTPTAVVSAATTTGYADSLCNTKAPAHVFQGKVVVCQRGIEVGATKSSNVQAGGAVGMILLAPSDVTSYGGAVDAYIPEIELNGPASTRALSFFAAHPGARAGWARGTAVSQPVEKMADFSSRGPTTSGILKPDVVAPGLDNYGAQSPDSFQREQGPKGQLYQGEQGTSFSTPIVAGATALLRRAHPAWTPGQVKSALMTSANTKILSSDGSAQATPFDDGSGRIQVDKATNPGLTLDESTTNFLATHESASGAVTLNLPNIYDDAMPDILVAHRTLKNVSGHVVAYRATVNGLAHSTVTPSSFTLAAGQSRTVTVVIDGRTSATGAWLTGALNLAGQRGAPSLRLPIVVRKGPGQAQLTSTCSSAALMVSAHAQCSATVTNNALVPVTGTIGALAHGAVRTAGNGSTRHITLAARTPEQVAMTPGSPFGFVPLNDLSRTVSYRFGDDGFFNFNLPSYTLGGHTYTKLGISQYGFAIPGGMNGSDVGAVINGAINNKFPDTATPNSVLAPFLTVLNPGAGDSLLVDVLNQTSTGKQWVVFQWQLYNNDGALEYFQLWVGINGADDIAYTYDPENVPTAASGLTPIIGVENDEGNRGVRVSGYQGTDYQISGIPAKPGGSTTLPFSVIGTRVGTGTVTTGFLSNSLSGALVDTLSISVTPKARSSQGVAPDSP